GGPLAAVLVHDPAGDRVDLRRLGLVERRRADEGVDLLRRERRDGGGRTGGLEQPPGGRQRRLVAGADRNDAGDQLLERRRIALVGQLEEGGLGEPLPPLADAPAPPAPV